MRSCDRVLNRSIGQCVNPCIQSASCPHPLRARTAESIQPLIESAGRGARANPSIHPIRLLPYRTTPLEPNPTRPRPPSHNSRFAFARAALLAAIEPESSQMRDGQGMGHLMVWRPFHPTKPAAVGLRIKRELVQARDGGVSPWFERWLAWLQRLRSLAILSLGDMIVVS